MRETATLEHKRDLSRTYLKTVSAFANYGTGSIVFGIADDGTTVGLDDPEGACLQVENAVNDSLDPVPRFALSIDEASRTVTLTVYEGAAKPYLYKGKAYRRADSSTVAASRIEYNRLVMRGMNASFDSLEAASQDLAFHRLDAELASKIGIKGLDANALISLELMAPSGMFTNAAAMLADKNDLPGIDMVRFGDSVSLILSRHTFERESVLLQMSQALAVFEEHFAYEEVIGAERVARSLVPREAFREALANALVHRCWDVNANVKVSMFPNRIEVTSPGGLPDGMTEQEYLAGGPSIARNPILANVLFRLGYIERFGTGIPRILEAYAELDVSPSFSVRPSSITVTLPVEQSVSLTEGERRVLGTVEKGSALTRAEIAEAAGLSKDKAIRVLNSLVQKGMVTREGSGRSVRYARR